MNKLPTKDEAKVLLEKYVADEYQKLHALMVGTAMEGYAEKFGLDEEEKLLWFLTGYLHDIDFHLHPTLHPGESLKWFKEWNMPGSLIHAVEAHADGYNGFNVKAETKLDHCLLACDEISGIFYAYKKLNPIPYSEMKISSIKKRVGDKTFAPKIDREHIVKAIVGFEVTLEEHIENLINFFGKLDKNLV
jgi:predicted hydrolase (HD superfamily)